MLGELVCLVVFVFKPPVDDVVGNAVVDVGNDGDDLRNVVVVLLEMGTEDMKSADVENTIFSSGNRKSTAVAVIHHSV